MSKPIDDGGPAFPQGHPEMTIAGQSVKETQGMSLRDWMAGMALSGMMNEPRNQRSLAVDDAEYCYAIADAMIAARKGVPP